MIDLRSDTVTMPTPEMRDFMFKAELGDDVYGEDPSVNRLQDLAAQMTGHQAALYVASGTQGNLISILTHCQRGDEYIAGQQAHTYRFEGGGAAVLGSVQPQPIPFNERGELDLPGITNLQALKTGALITFSCEAGTILGRAEPRARQALVGYARDLGLAFQIVDDLLDSQSTPEELGKPTGQDEAAGKATFVGLLGPDCARAKAQDLIDSACARLDIFSEKADLLKRTARFVLERRS